MTYHLFKNLIILFVCHNSEKIALYFTMDLLDIQRTATRPEKDENSNGVNWKFAMLLFYYSNKRGL